MKKEFLEKLGFKLVGYQNDNQMTFDFVKKLNDGESYFIDICETT